MKSKLVGLALIATAAFLAPLTAFSCQTSDLKISNVTVLAGPPGQLNTAGYAQFHNKGKEACVITGATSSISQTVELHTVTETNGMMKMQKVSEFTVPANGDLVLAPGGNHLMFMKLNHTLKPKEEVSMTLLFKDGQQLPIKATVQDMRENIKMDHSGH